MTQKELLDSYEGIRHSVFFKQMLHTLETGLRITQQNIVNADDKEKSWEAVCEHRGVIRTVEAVKILIRQCEEGLNNDARSDETN